MVNEVYLLGRVGRDAECQESNRPVSFSVATWENFRDEDADNGWRTETTWHNVIIWGTPESKARLLEKVKKGCWVAVKGKIDVNSWEDGDGNKKTFVRVLAKYAKVLPQIGDQAEPSDKPSSKPAAENKPAADDDDLPF